MGKDAGVSASSEFVNSDSSSLNDIGKQQRKPHFLTSLMQDNANATTTRQTSTSSLPFVEVRKLQHTAKPPEEGWHGLDFTYKRTTIDEAFHATRVNDCLDRPRDPRVVAFVPALNPESLHGSRLQKDDTVVARIEFLCCTMHVPSGNPAAKHDLQNSCQLDHDEGSDEAGTADSGNPPSNIPSQRSSRTTSRGTSALREHNLNDGQEGPTSDEEDPDYETLRRGLAQRQASKSTGDTSSKTPAPPRCGVKLVIEITVAQYRTHTCTIFQRGHHEEIPLYMRKESLQYSRLIRNHIRRQAGHLGTTLSTINKDLVELRKRHPWIPDWRWPTPKQVNDCVEAFRRHARLDENQLVGAQMLKDRNPNEFFLHHTLTDTQDFLAGITGDNALDSALCYMNNGIAMDSTWRALNQNGCPMTHLVTYNDNHRMLPIVSFLSQNIKTETLVTVLESLKTRMLEHAEIVSEQGADYQEKATILNNARAVVDAGVWSPRFVMIDKDRAERNALAAAFPEVPIRLCQFHVVQAILRWFTDGEKRFEEEAEEAEAVDDASQNPPTKKGRKPKKRDIIPRLPNEAKLELLQCFRELQRWRHGDGPWSSAVDDFTSSIYKICEKHNCTTRMGTAVTKYFQDNWFIDEWRDMWTDAGLPDGLSRDAILNTNNWIEAAFRTFKLVFLGNRHNKRVDRLIAILINDYYPYYALWPPSAPRPSETLLQATEWGYNLWKIGHFECSWNDDGHQIWRITRKTRADPGAEESEKDQEESVTVIQIGADGYRKCQCRRFRSTGKYCHHLWAMSWLEACGPMAEYDDAVHREKPKTKGKDGKRDEKRNAVTESGEGGLDPYADVNEALLEDLQRDQESLFSDDGWKVGMHEDGHSQLIPRTTVSNEAQRDHQYLGESAYASVTAIKRPRHEIESGDVASRKRQRSDASDIEEQRQSPRYALPNHKAKTGRDALGEGIRQASRKTASSTRVAPSGKKSTSPRKKMNPSASTPINKGLEGTGQLHHIDGVEREVFFPPICKAGVGLINPAYSLTCYANSFLQVLVHLPVVVEVLLAVDINNLGREYEL
ncbi:hypothetical protein QFC20_004358 [Naganishia adeliensis]|uniref:Uncharacterized protein n=1 Tax=Naganishia adeliensis TaxID=92952 RepID=A0ACC2W1B4_9TREE|nr:hypothetical protein QFC20_004358 [Naganishia adeliensis]